MMAPSHSNSAPISTPRRPKTPRLRLYLSSTPASHQTASPAPSVHTTTKKRKRAAAPTRKRKIRNQYQHEYNDLGIWSAEKILAENESKYLIKWAGTDEKGDPWPPTWEPKQNPTPDLIADWEAKKTKDKTRAQEQDSETTSVVSQINSSAELTPQSTPIFKKETYDFSDEEELPSKKQKNAIPPLSSEFPRSPRRTTTPAVIPTQNSQFNREDYTYYTQRSSTVSSLEDADHDPQNHETQEGEGQAPGSEAASVVALPDTPKEPSGPTLSQFVIPDSQGTTDSASYLPSTEAQDDSILSCEARPFTLEVSQGEEEQAEEHREEFDPIEDDVGTDNDLRIQIEDSQDEPVLSEERTSQITSEQRQIQPSVQETFELDSTEAYLTNDSPTKRSSPERRSVEEDISRGFVSRENSPLERTSVEAEPSECLTTSSIHEYSRSPSIHKSEVEVLGTQDNITQDHLLEDKIGVDTTSLEVGQGVQALSSAIVASLETSEIPLSVISPPESIDAAHFELGIQDEPKAQIGLGTNIEEVSVVPQLRSVRIRQHEPNTAPTPDKTTGEASTVVTNVKQSIALLLSHTDIGKPVDPTDPVKPRPRETNLSTEAGASKSSSLKYLNSNSSIIRPGQEAEQSKPRAVEPNYPTHREGLSQQRAATPLQSLLRAVELALQPPQPLAPASPKEQSSSTTADTSDFERSQFSLNKPTAVTPQREVQDVTATAAVRYSLANGAHVNLPEHRAYHQTPIVLPTLDTILKSSRQSQIRTPVEEDHLQLAPIYRAFPERNSPVIRDIHFNSFNPYFDTTAGQRARLDESVVQSGFTAIQRVPSLHLQTGELERFGGSSPIPSIPSGSAVSEDSHPPLPLESLTAMSDTRRSVRGRAEEVTPRSVTRLLAPSPSTSTRSPSVIPAEVVGSGAAPETATELSGLAPVLPAETAEMDEDMTISQIHDEQGYSGLLDEPRVAPEEMIIPLHLDSAQADDYYNYFLGNEELLQQFVAGPCLETDREFGEAQKLLEKLNNNLLHVDLNNRQTSLSMLTPVDEADWAVRSSSKFRFLDRFFCREEYRNSHLKVAIIAQEGRLLELLATFFEGRKINHQRPDIRRDRPYNWKARNTIKIYPPTPVDTSPDRFDFVICFDGSSDPAGFWVQQLRMMLREPHEPLCPVISLVVPSSVEHVERCILRSGDRVKRLQLILSCAMQLAPEVKRPENAKSKEYPEATAAADRLFELCQIEERRLVKITDPWPFPALHDITQYVEIYSQSDDPSEDYSVASSALQGTREPTVPRKRRLEFEEGEVGKKMRPTPQPDGLFQSTTGGSAVSQLGNSTSRLERDQQLQAATEATQVAKAELASKEKALRVARKTMDDIQNRFEDQSKEVRALKRSVQTAVEEREKFYQRSIAKNDEIADLKKKLEEALALSRRAENPSIAEFAALRDRRDILEEKTKRLESTVRSKEGEIDFFRGQYQERDSNLREATLRNRELEEQVSRLSKEADVNKLALQEKTQNNYYSNMEARCKRLEQEKASLQALVKKQALDLEKATRQRPGVGTRANSVPRSPRLGARAPGSRGGSPMPANSRVGILRNNLEGR